MIRFDFAESAKDAHKCFVRVSKDEDGATLVEYSILIGLMTVSVMIMVFAISGWVSDKWSSLNSALG